MKSVTNRGALSRRDFLKAGSAVALATGAGLAPKRLRAQGSQAPPGDRVRVGVIGLGGRGMALMNEFASQPDVDIISVCDVSWDRLVAAKQRTENKAETFADFRALLEKSPADAVVVATPPHWHPLISLAALQAGKDVYCEKPIALYPDEARAMAKAATDNSRVTQVGTQIHSLENFRRAVEIVRSGALGRISCVRTQVTVNEAPGPVPIRGEEQVPQGLDWDMWLGPLPMQPFKSAMINVGHRYFKECVHSWLNELGPHIMDLAIWAMDPGEPLAVSATGGRFGFTDGSTIPDTIDVLFEYPDYNMTFVHSMVNGYNFGFGPPPGEGRHLAVFFHGTEATLAADYGSYKVFTEKGPAEDFAPEVETIPSSPGHVREFVDGIKTRQQPLCNFDYHLPLAIALTLAHTSLFSGERVRWDAEKGEVIGSAKARELARAKYRAPWKLPRV